MCSVLSLPDSCTTRQGSSSVPAEQVVCGRSLYSWSAFIPPVDHACPQEGIVSHSNLLSTHISNLLSSHICLLSVCTTDLQSQPTSNVCHAVLCRAVLLPSDGMVVCHMPYGPTAYFGIFNTVLRHDIGQKKEVGTISEVYPHLIFDKFNSQLGQRFANILKHLFPVPKDDSKRVVTFANDNDYISFRHHTYTAPRGAKSIELKEVRAGGSPGGFEGAASLERDRHSQASIACSTLLASCTVVFIPFVVLAAAPPIRLCSAQVPHKGYQPGVSMCVHVHLPWLSI